MQINNTLGDALSRSRIIVDSPNFKNLDSAIRSGKGPEDVDNLIVSMLNSAWDTMQKNNRDYGRDLALTTDCILECVPTPMLRGRTEDAKDIVAILRRHLSRVLECPNIPVINEAHPKLLRDIVSQLNASVRSSVSSKRPDLVEAYLEWYEDIRSASRQECADTAFHMEWGIEFRTIQALEYQHADIARILIRHGSRLGQYCYPTFVNRKFVDSLTPEMKKVYEECRWLHEL